jgi:outer membrane receptor protein involved in Fe transport
MVAPLQWLCAAVYALSALPVPAAGRVEGRITRPNGSPLAGIRVTIAETSRTTLSDERGAWSLGEIDDGTYTLTFSLNQFSESEPVTVAGDAVTIDRVLTWPVLLEETVVVYGATRQRERLVETPVSAGIISAATIAREGGQGLLPKLLAAEPAVEVVQNGLYDFNINLRGFNRVLNRRVLVLLDGRDPGGVLLGAQEWVATGMDPQQIAQVEVIRGPGSALYGANAFNGVISFISREPSAHPGGYAQVTFGERNTFGVSAATAGRMGSDWSYRAFGSASRTDDFYRDRTTSVEYPGLQLEAVPPRDRTYGVAGTLRVDRALDAGLWTVEGGTTQSSGQVFLAAVGRSQTVMVHRPWIRSTIQQSWWQAIGYVDGRQAESLALNTGGSQFDHSIKAHGEFLARLDMPSARARMLAGASIHGDRIDTADADGRQTVLSGVQRGRAGAVFAQADWQPGDAVTLIAALRVDQASTYPVQVSPRVGGAFTLAPGHTLRASYGQAFQAPSYGELNPLVNVIPPLDLSALEAALQPVVGGVPLGFASVPVLALGNEALDVERVDTVEAGYSGVVGTKVHVSAEYYRSHMRNFISAFLPNVGTSLGRVNPAYQAYAPPAALGAAQQALVLGTLEAVLPTLYPVMSNDASGAPIFAAYSLTNYGEVLARGAEIDVRIFPAPAWTIGVGYSLFHFDVRQDLPDDPIQANAAPHRANLSVVYGGARWSASGRWRWSDQFEWANGLQRGPVPAHNVVDLAGTAGLSRRMSLRVSVANVLNHEHYEIFGGDLLGRRAMADVQVKWD